MKVKYIRTTPAVPKLEVSPKGEWVDLTLAEKAILLPNDHKVLSLGIRMQLPKGFEAWIIPRSSTYKKYKMLLSNSFGLIDNLYCGVNDIWGFSCFAPQGCNVKAGTRICQFRIMPSMKAGFWVKLKWLLCKKVEFVEEEYLKGGNISRGGFGSTGD